MVSLREYTRRNMDQKKRFYNIRNQFLYGYTIYT